MPIDVSTWTDLSDAIEDSAHINIVANVSFHSAISIKDIVDLTISSRVGATLTGVLSDQYGYAVAFDVAGLVLFAAASNWVRVMRRY